MENWNRYQPGVDDKESKIGVEYESKSITSSAEAELARTATGQAQIGADEDPSIDAKTFIACLALSFLWTGSQIPLYMLLVCVDYTLAAIGGATIQIWFILGPIAALAATAPIAGSVADIFGRRWTILAGGASLIIGLILVGTANDFPQVLVSFPFSGIGAGLLEINSLSAVNEIAPNKLRGFYTSMLTWTLLPFFPLGIYAFEMAENSTWRWCIWLSIIWLGIGQVMTFIFYRPPPRMVLGRVIPLSEKLMRVDWLGFTLSLIGIVLFLFGLGSGGYSRPWKTAYVILPLIIGFLLLVALGYWSTWARHPLYPPRMFKNTRVFLLTLVITAVAGANFFSILILWPKYITSAFQLSPVHTGLLVLGQTMGILFGAGFFSATITRYQGSIRPQMIIACALMMVGFGPMVLLDENKTALAAVLVTIGCIGVGGIIIPASVITQLCSPDEFLGTVTALTFVARVLGGAIGFTVYYYILNKDMLELFSSYATNKTALAVVTIPLKLGFTTPQIISFLTSYAINDVKALLSTPKVTKEVIKEVALTARPLWAEGFNNVWLVSLAFSGLGLGCSIFLGDVKKYMTNHRAVHM